MGAIKNILLVAALSAFAASCTTYNQDGDLVRHHFGYVKIITPKTAGGTQPIQALNIETVGFWLDVDRRESAKTGSGAGIGYRFDRREFIPLDCRVVFRVSSEALLEQAEEWVKGLQKGSGEICPVHDWAH